MGIKRQTCDLAKERRRARRKETGFQPEAHREDDATRGKHKRTDESNAIHLQYVELWIEFLIESGRASDGYELEKGSPVPEITLIKEFIRWYVHSTKGRLDPDGRPTVVTTMACAERFFGGFETATGNMIAEADRSEIYGVFRLTLSQWIKGTLTKQKVIVKMEKEKFNFTKTDYNNTVSSIWTVDDPVFIHGTMKVFLLFALQLYLFTGARVGAFIPRNRHQHQRGLRYKTSSYFVLILLTSHGILGGESINSGSKKNRDPEYTVFGIGIRDHSRPQFASGLLLASIGINQGTLYGINTLEDLAQLRLLEGEDEIPLRWRHDALEKPVFRNVTAQGVQDLTLTTERFCYFLRQNFRKANYSKVPKIHDIRRALGKKVDGRYGSALVSQLYGHKDGKTYETSYLSYCSSMDTVACALDEEKDDRHIEYFQGYKQFCEPGLPGQLPAGIEESILESDELAEIRSRSGLADATGNKDLEKYERLQYRKTHTRLRLSALTNYRTQWVRDRRDWRVLSGGQKSPDEPERNACTRALALIMPEIGRLAAIMSSTDPMSFDEKLLFMKDLQKQCSRNYDVIYLPNEAPVNGKCPVASCQEDVHSMAKSSRSAHIHECIRTYKASQFGVSKLDMKFCYECMQWFHTKHQWREHCEHHLMSWGRLHCEVIIYRYTIIRPGYCPCCIRDESLKAEERLRYWCHSKKLRDHIKDTHLQRMKWPTTDPLCGCPRSFDNARDFCRHLYDVHGFTKGIWQSNNADNRDDEATKVLGVRGKKRALQSEQQQCNDERSENCAKKSRTHNHGLAHVSKFGLKCTSTEPEKKPPKELRFCHYRPPRPNSQQYPSDNACMTNPTQASFVEDQPRRSESSDRCDNTSASSRRNSIASCVSDAADSHLSSQPTTPGLDAIDPRILVPIGFNIKNDCPNYDPEPIQPHILSSVGLETKNESKDMIDANPPFPSPANPSREDCINDVDDSTSRALETCCLIPSNNTTVAVDDKCEEHPHTQAETDGNPPCDDQADVSNVRRPLTRAKSRLQPPLNNPDDLGTRKLRQKLNTREKRKLLELKGKKMTIRQIGPLFADIDTVFLRQSWEDMELPQRCTRSRASRTSRRD
ncbi:hypothetical protein N7530_011455 [Penicillium desertorum]|uniref:C2H2-type domain-containing protein n=1 Tax=Penicillium desertorum TaxID=1303715 RepID=A0A9W9WDG2_9EURO|nr:hypothetical protein N7530_011455 [Penicillium desertorum]